MRSLILVIALAILAGCATVGTGEQSRVFHDRKYNTYHRLRSDEAATVKSRTVSAYDRELPAGTRNEAGE